MLDEIERTRQQFQSNSIHSVLCSVCLCCVYDYYNSTVGNGYGQCLKVTYAIMNSLSQEHM